MIKKHGSAEWSGGLQDGTGSVSTESGVLNATPYGFNKRFGDEPGTNPEELIGAAHAACFSMALSNILGEDDIVPEKIETRSTIHLEMEGGPKVVKAHLDVTIKAPADENKVMEAAKKAEQGCPISQLLDCEITMDAKVL
ncbi:OsmC family protein [Maritimibacter sp. UBA3975]|uniref:OsmC family protein n=1 Tax=Maritimibacter sp. UBA3975 TaxID=1946833 RepID=UPI000C0B5563|nr:OsmC family protein [Maritimibacter sp. UBA3975]MAM61733.1 peroxiredoxin [Maritimibacter sp.]|tara:strand:- start:183 stop:602 length:420 start_codon:yes stop_codon:yes gene_type:complete